MRPTPTDLVPHAITAGQRRADALEALRLLVAYTNPLRVGLPLSNTEAVAATRAAQILRKGSRS